MVQFHSGFVTDCPDGKLKRSKVLKMYEMILPAGNANMFVDQIYRIFDQDMNGSISFMVFIYKVGQKEPIMRANEIM